MILIISFFGKARLDGVSSQNLRLDGLCKLCFKERVTLSAAF